MNWDAVGALGETVGAFAVVVSLIYLALQLRTQNRESQIASVHEIMEGFRNAMAILEHKEKADIFLRGNENYDSLDDVEMMQYIAIGQQILRVWEEAYHQHRVNRLPSHVWEPMQKQFAQFISTNGAKRLWELRSQGYSDQFVSYIAELTPLEFRVK